MSTRLGRGTFIALGFVVAVQLVGAPILEGFFWDSQLGRLATGLGPAEAEHTAKIGKNMAIYNMFFGAALLWAPLALGARQAYSTRWLVLSFVAVAGLVGALTLGNPGTLLLQTLPALVALRLIWVDRPYPKTEAEAIREIIKIERQILALKSVDLAVNPAEADPSAMNPAPVVPRGQHPKMHGLVRAEFIVAEGLPAGLGVGLFREPGRRYDALIRFSNARNADDRDKGGHGMAIKLLDAPAPDSDPGQAVGSIQDFVLFDAPAFFVGDALEYVEFEDATLRAYGRPKVYTLASTFLNYYWCRPRQLRNLLKTQRGDVADPLAIDYHGVTPYALGPVAVKYRARRVDPRPATAVDSADRLRLAMGEVIAGGDVEFEFQVQVQADPRSMPIEDAAADWDRSASEPRTVATIRIVGGQDFDRPEARALAERLSFTPWRTLPEHRPLGGINRARRMIYESLAEFRHALNRASPAEPERSPPAD